MKNFIFIILVIFIYSSLGAQDKILREQKNEQLQQRDSLRNFNKTNSLNNNKKANIVDYKIISFSRDTNSVDTTLTIKKDYKFNYLQRDDFGLLPFTNIGQSYNSLIVNTEENSILPLFAARSRHFNYMEVEDINYYRVPTPWTRLTYKTAFEQGQLLDAFFTVNLSNQFNFSIAYKGLRSLGNYQNVLTSTGNFRFTSNYTSKNKRYSAKGHIVMQDLLNQENGGLTDDGVQDFRSGDEEFLDRSVFDPNFNNAENILEGKRFYFEHDYDIIRQNDSISKNRLQLLNQISFEDKYYQYVQDSPAENFFGDSFSNNINDKVTLENFHTEIALRYYNNILGDFKFGLTYTNINYGYNTIVLLPSENIPNRIKSNFLGTTASYSKTIGKIDINGSAQINLSEEFSGSIFNGMVGLKLNQDISLDGGVQISSRLPNYNHLLYQSDYTNYNWYNYGSFENVNKQQLSFNIRSDKYLNAYFDLSNISNYTYFNLQNKIDENRIIKPQQYNSSIQYLKLKVQKEFTLGNFALDNTVMYQSTVSDLNVLNVPTLITRNSLYYTNQLFKKAMTLQTGVTLNYFTEYNMNGYDPLLAEFYTQNETKLGGFPRLDFFINAKIRQTRIFFKAEHFNSSFTGFDYFSAPNHPFRDFTIRFGLVWDFFL
ncbi:putative porin [Winogradskyella ursingii]|uniref:putative porin n=1 Tax=Winogradskyella ursingii TaxID=2686079 RepID=UPI0015C9CA27|nr:putative porin [Winogradskyella ursingii]